MPYQTQRNDELIELQLWGRTSKWEVLAALREVRALAPRKELSDLWTVGPACMIPWDEYASIVDAVQGFCTADMQPSRTAIVVGGEFQIAQADIYVQQARSLPFPIRVFTRRDNALAWLKGGEGEQTG